MVGIHEPIWELRGISKAFPGVKALDNVSFDLYPGEVHALLGENGSGKSTLAKCLSGVYLPEAGQIFHKGQPVVFRNPLEARVFGVATIYQEFSLIPTLTVAENIFLGRYFRKAGSGLIDWPAMRLATSEVLDQLSLQLDPDSVVKDLSVAEQQLVEIAKAISMESSLLIMDEPTAALGIVETQRLLELIRRLASQDKGIIYISHRLDEVFQIADRITILKDGRRVTTAPVEELKIREAVRLMIGFDIQQHYPKEFNSQPVPCLEVENLTTENGVHGVSFTVNVGEVFGLGGMLGSGRTEIARAIYGVDSIQNGRICLYGREVRFRSPTEAIANGVGLIPENRKVDGCFFNFEGTKNITISRLTDLLRGPFLNLSAENRVGQEYVKKLNITPAALEKSVQFLSGGNQQKVIIARWLFSEARLLILDEPTQGIDIGAKLEVYKLINNLTKNGISVILISSDFPELLAISDRIGIVRDGRILYTAESQRLSEYQLIGMASGVGMSEEIERWMHLSRIAYPHLKALRDQTRLTAHLAVLDRREMQLFYLDKIGEGLAPIQSRSGATAPLHCTGLGKVLLAFEPEETVRAWVAKEGLQKYTEQTLIAPEAFLSELARIREQGYGQEVEEYETNMRSIAAPLRSPQGEVIAAISLTGTADKLPVDLHQSRLCEDLRETAASINRALVENEVVVS